MYGNFSGNGTKCASSYYHMMVDAMREHDIEEAKEIEREEHSSKLAETEAMIRRILKDNPNAQINININC